MPEQVFHKGTLTAYAYNAAEAINLRSDGWVEGAAPPSDAAPEPEIEAEPKAATSPEPGPELVVPTPVDPAPTAQEAPAP